MDPDFDAYVFGKASVVNWINYQLTPYTGQWFMPFTDAEPDLPGVGFAGEKTIAESIRHRREKLAARKFRGNP
jgi:hypothetical protein